MLQNIHAQSKDTGGWLLESAHLSFQKIRGKFSLKPHHTMQHVKFNNIQGRRKRENIAVGTLCVNIARNLAWASINACCMVTQTNKRYGDLRYRYFFSVSRMLRLLCPYVKYVE